MQRIDRLDWERVSNELDGEGHSVMEQVFSPAECQTIASLYSHDDLFRSRIVMARHGFGRGEYKYFQLGIIFHDAA
jgi:hypothetical protein